MGIGKDATALKKWFRKNDPRSDAELNKIAEECAREKIRISLFPELEYGKLSEKQIEEKRNNLLKRYEKYIKTIPPNDPEGWNKRAWWPVGVMGAERIFLTMKKARQIGFENQDLVKKYFKALNILSIKNIIKKHPELRRYFPKVIDKQSSLKKLGMQVASAVAPEQQGSVFKAFAKFLDRKQASRLKSRSA